jgi:hypothetical protein
MAKRGGYRPGAGRPKRKGLAGKDTQCIAEITAKGESPLEYMLRVMRDVTADVTRRDRMAIAAASFIHVRRVERQEGKREETNKLAKTAHEESSWGELINRLN